jgi:hypothetical protein
LAAGHSLILEIQNAKYKRQTPPETKNGVKAIASTPPLQTTRSLHFAF